MSGTVYVCIRKRIQVLSYNNFDIYFLPGGFKVMVLQAVEHIFHSYISVHPSNRWNFHRWRLFVHSSYLVNQQFETKPPNHSPNHCKGEGRWRTKTMTHPFTCYRWNCCGGGGSVSRDWSGGGSVSRGWSGGGSVSRGWSGGGAGGGDSDEGYDHRGRGCFCYWAGVRLCGLWTSEGNAPGGGDEVEDVHWGVNDDAEGEEIMVIVPGALLTGLEDEGVLLFWKPS